MHKETAKLLSGIFPESQPLDVLIERCVTRRPDDDWKRIPRDTIDPFCTWSAFRLICKECAPKCYFITEEFERPRADDTFAEVDVIRYRCREVGREDQFKFWLPATVWIGICPRCGTVYWDRD